MSHAIGPSLLRRPHAHAGDLKEHENSPENIVVFDSDAPIVTNAGGCGAMLTSYGHLFANDRMWPKRLETSLPESGMSVNNCHDRNADSTMPR